MPCDNAEHQLRTLGSALVLGAVCALVGCGGSPSSSFEIIRDQQQQRYDSTRITLEEEDSELVLLAWNTRDPIPDAADDEYSDGLRVVFDKDALEELATNQDQPISGEGSWTSTSGIRPGEVTFTPTGMHTAAVEHMFFTRQRFGCIDEDHGPGAQTFEGTLRLNAMTASRLAGIITVRVEGDVPCTDNLHQFYQLTLVFDQSYREMGADAGTDASVLPGKRHTAASATRLR
jgi:hypothetical protein